MPTPADTLEIAEVCLYLSTIDIAKRNAMQRGALVNRTPQLIYMAYRAMKKIYDKDSSYAGLQVLADYIYWLCGRYALKAIGILDLGNNGAVAGITPEIATALAWIYEEIEVGADGSPLAAGDTTYTLNYPNIIQHSVRVELPQSNIPQAETNQFSYDAPIYSSSNCIINFTNDDGEGNNIGLEAGMILILTGARIVTSFTVNPATAPPTITVLGTQISANVYADPSYFGYNLTVFQNGVRFLKKDTDFTVNAGGGFTLIGSYAGLTLTSDDEFIISPNGLLS